MAMLEPGDPAPDFDTVDHHGQPVRLADYRGRQPVVVYFYPKGRHPRVHSGGLRLSATITRISSTPGPR